MAMLIHISQAQYNNLSKLGVIHFWVTLSRAEGFHSGKKKNVGQSRITPHTTSMPKLSMDSKKRMVFMVRTKSDYLFLNH